VTKVISILQTEALQLPFIAYYFVRFANMEYIHADHLGSSFYIPYIFD